MPLPPPPSLLHASDRWSPSAPCAVAVGNFDGVHVGHAEIVGRLAALAAVHRLPTAVLTFDPHPAAVLRPESAPPPLSTPRRRAELLAALGVDAVFVQPTDRQLTSLSAESFHREILRGRLAAAAIVEGADFRFGAGRTGDVALLATLCREDGIPMEVVEPVLADGKPVSSSRIRSLIGSGQVAEANRLLTAAYRLSGTVVVGAQRGRTIGFPTANLSGIETLVPAGGVYAGRARSPSSASHDWHPAAIHVGPNATFGETGVSVEVHLLGFEGDLYGRQLDVDFLERLRETRRFASVDLLTEQLRRDVAAAARIATH